MNEAVLTASIYEPTAPRTGSAGQTMLRLGNMLLSGIEPQIYLTAYKGSLSLSETIPTSDLTGTLTAGIGVKSLVGTGTAFTTELRSGQFFFAGADLFVVDQIIDDTHLTVYRGPSVVLVAAVGKRMPVLFEIDRQRGTLIQGNAVKFDKGTILGTGFGTLRINGATLQSGSMILTTTPKIAIYNPSTGNYTVYDLGMNTPTVTPGVTSVVGGTKNMQAHHYSLRLVPSRTATGGYNNPGPKTEFDITTNGHKAAVNVAGVAMDSTHGQDAWDAYGSESTADGIQGPWFYITTVTSADIVANVFNVEWLDAEINRSGLLDLSIDMGPPPPSGFIAVIEGNPVWISCSGKNNLSPGPSIVPAMPRNIEAAPAEWNVTSSPPETILGVVTALARLHLLTPMSLQQAIYAPSPDPLIPPISLRPYWRSGFANPYQLVFVNGMLIGYSHSGPTRSAANAEEASEEHSFGAKVAEIIQSWVGAHVLVACDPNPAVNGVCFFHPADSKNDAGYWRTRVLIFGLRQNDWIGDVFIESDTRDMIVCGLATVNNQLSFLAGGRMGAGVQVDTFDWNKASGSPVNYYAAWQLGDGGIQNRNKSIRAYRVTGKLTTGNIKLHGFDSAANISVTDIEAGLNSVSGSLSLGSQANAQQLTRQPGNWPNLALFTARVAGTYNGSDTMVDRVDEVVLEFIPSGNRR